MKMICLIPLLLGLLAAGPLPMVHSFTLPLLSGQTRPLLSSSSSSSFPCFLIRSSTSSGGTTNIGNSGKNVPFFATVETASGSNTDTSSTGTMRNTESSVAIEEIKGLVVEEKATSLGGAKSVYDKTPISQHIKLTDYLRNPSSLPRTVLTSANTTMVAAKAPILNEKESKAIMTSYIALSASNGELLEEAISTFDNAAAKRILAKLSEMRQTGADQQSTMASLLDGLLEQAGHNRQSRTTSRVLSQWTRFRFLTRFSKRARLASLRRTLDLVTPPTMSASDSTSSVDDDDDDVESKKRRQRRAFVSLLSTLAKPLDDEASNPETPSSSRRRKGPLPAIAILEKKARREQKQKQLLKDEDLILRRPQNLETPNYTIVVASNKRPGADGLEVRYYEPYALCSVNMGTARPPDAYKTDAVISEPKLKGASSFGALAGYLFGKNQQATAMKMTTPVFTTLNSNDDDVESDDAVRQGRDEKMSFVLPSEFWKDDETLAMAPQPLDGSGVTLERIEGGHRAVVMFGGYATKENVAQRKRELLQKLDKDPDWRVVGGSNNNNDSSRDDYTGVLNRRDHAFALAQYNDPFTPPWKRLNEVSIAVERR